ncbi:MAG: DUF4345 family protein [Saprospiraceae bacterium]|nr:DUF4345 family protein [Saprospiraceae bacterium]
MEILTIVTLALSGLLLSFVGASRLRNPINAYLKNSGITLAKEVDLLNEMRGVSGLMLMGGILILLGILLPQLTFTSHVVASLLFLGFAIGRILSMRVDGQPNKQIAQGLIFELVFGGLNVVCVILTQF